MRLNWAGVNVATCSNACYRMQPSGGAAGYIVPCTKGRRTLNAFASEFAPELLIDIEGAIRPLPYSQSPDDHVVGHSLGVKDFN